MRTYLIRAAFVVAALSLASPALAAYNDVTLSTDVTLSVNSVTLNVYSASSTIETLTVNDTNFTATLQANSSLIVQAPSLNILNYTTDQSAGITTVCTSATSTLTVSATQATTITVTPSSSACPRTDGSGSSSGSGSGSNGPIVSSGGGGGSPSAIVPAASTTPAAPASGLSDGQIQSILSLLQSFGADQSVIDKVNASLRGSAAASAGALPALTVPLKKGSTGAQVKVLQKMLNRDAGTQVASSGAGSPGHETTLFGAATMKAVEKFQIKWSIAKAGDVGYGLVGPKTRAKLNSLYAQ